MRRCGTCGAHHHHASGCPDSEEPLGRPERDPDEVLEERRDHELERARNVDAGDHLDSVAKAKGYL
jgi:hypothetical protein